MKINKSRVLAKMAVVLVGMVALAGVIGLACWAMGGRPYPLGVLLLAPTLLPKPPKTR